MTKKIWTLVSVLLVAMLMLAACSPAAAPAPEQEQETETTLQGTISLWHSLKEGEANGMNATIAAFQAEHPDVVFDVLFVPNDDIRGKFETAVATGGGPSLLVGSADWGPALYAAELTADLTPMASSAFLNTINQAALDAVRYQGALVGLPYGLKGVVMYRNASIVSEAPTSFDDLVAKANAATQGDVLGANLEYGFFFSAAHLHALGGELMNDAGDPTFNTAEGAAWLTMLNRFKEAGPTEYYTDNDVNLFKAGKVGIIIDGAWNLNDLAAAIGADNLKVDPWPSGMSGYVQQDNLYMNANVTGNNQAATWAFMEFLSTAEAQAMTAEQNTGFLPSTLGVEVTDRLRSEVVTAFERGVAFPVIPEMGAYWGPMDNALQMVFDTGADPADVLQTAFDSVTAAIVEIRGGQ
jgi:arabinogalactan oligomer / maltooligosaccharide transport system substrate-binding protein